MKYHIEKNSVQETLVIPLFGRLVCSEHFPDLFSAGALNYDVNILAGIKIWYLYLAAKNGSAAGEGKDDHSANQKCNSENQV